MKHITFFASFLAINLSLIISCKESSSKKDSTTNTQGIEVGKQETARPDFRNYPQYVYCKIDGQPYLSTYVYNAMNLPNRHDFTTHTEEKINGETVLSNMDFSFYTLEKVGVGILTHKDFYITGGREFTDKHISFGFNTGPDQKLNLVSFKDDLLEGTFSFDVKDATDPSRILKITDGVFKMKIEGKTNLKFDKNGDVNMDTLLKSIN